MSSWYSLSRTSFPTTSRTPLDNPSWPAPAIPTAAARAAPAHAPPSARLAAAPRARARAARPPAATAARRARSRPLFTFIPGKNLGENLVRHERADEPTSDVFAADRAKGFDRAIDVMFTTARRPSCNSTSLNLYSELVFRNRRHFLLKPLRLR